MVAEARLITIQIVTDSMKFSLYHLSREHLGDSYFLVSSRLCGGTIKVFYSEGVYHELCKSHYLHRITTSRRIG
jgi:hypothetical protein